MKHLPLSLIGRKKALQSPCKFKVSAIGFDHKGDYLGAACNYPDGDRGVHAEEALIARYGSKLRTIFIFRVNKNGKLLPINPCEKCLQRAAKYGINIVSNEGE